MMDACAVLESSVPDLSPADLARERRIAFYLSRANAAASERIRKHWMRAAQTEIARRSEFARAEAARAAMGEDGW